MGLIDVLTQYDTKKKAVHAAKAVKHGVRHQGLVCICCSEISGEVNRVALNFSSVDCNQLHVSVCFAGRSRNLSGSPRAVR